MTLSISVRADAKKDYGKLLKAEMQRVSNANEISSDSLVVELKRLDQNAKTETNAVVKAIYNTVLSHSRDMLNRHSHRVTIDYDILSDAATYRQRALENPAALAAAKAGDYEPFAVKGIDSHIFDGDMLSMVGNELKAYDVMEAYYSKTDRREAACMSSALRINNEAKRIFSGNWKNDKTISAYDSLVALYGDLDVACEVAIMRYERMNSWTAATAKEKMNYLNESIARWQSWKRVGKLENERTQLTLPTCNLHLPTTSAFPMQSLTVDLNGLRNVKNITMRVYKLSGDGKIDLGSDGKRISNDKHYARLKSGATLLAERTQTKTYSGKQPYEVFNDSIEIAPLPVGVYLLEFDTNPLNIVKRTLLYVSNLGIMAEELPGGKVRFVVVDATTGQPISGAKIDVAIEKEYNTPLVWSTLECDKQGEAIFNKGVYDIKQVFPYTATDRFTQSADVATHYYLYRNRSNPALCRVFTDRAIYRPGQTVQFSAVYYKSGEKASVLSDRKLKVALRDVNNKIISEKELTTDAFGGLSGEFTLPKTTQGGQFCVSVSNIGRCYFRVEEYKRPTFRVDISKIETAYEAGDTVMLTGKAESFAGVAVQGATVRYSIKRTTPFWWRYYSIGNSARETTVLSGEAVTADDGSFTISVPLMLPEELSSPIYFYNFVVNAEITDAAGETQSATTNIPLGTKKGRLSVDLPKKVLATDVKTFKFIFTNAAGEEVDAKVRYRFDGEKAMRHGATNTEIMLDKQSRSGRHTIFAICEDDTLEYEYVVFSLNDKRPPVESDEWFYTSHDQFPSDGGVVTVQMGTSEKNIHAVYSVIAGETIVESGTFRLSNSINARQFRYKEEYGNGLLITCAWMKDGQLHRYATTIRKPLPNKELKLTWSTFRDRLTPGSTEQWTLNITHADGTPAEARLIATLYDKALDKFSTPSWYINTKVSLSLPTTEWTTLNRNVFYRYISKEPNIEEIKAFDLGHFDMEFNLNNINTRYGMAIISSTAMADSPKMLLKEEIRVKGSNAVSEAATADSMTESEVTATHSDAPNQLRENFNETAFFAPSIISDAEGNVAMTFTLPESVTTWRFLALAHTKDMSVGTITADAIAKKAVMVMPNIPRFIRQGDNATITTRIVNTAEDAVAGKVRMTLLNPELGDTVYTDVQEFTVEKGKTETATFDFSVGDSQPLLVCIITAEGEGFTDGEQHYLPVLSDKETVVKTLPFILRDKGEKTIDITSLFPEDSENRKLIVEYTENPAWMMIESLAAACDADGENAISQAAALYANTIAMQILSHQTGVDTLFDKAETEERIAAALEQLKKLQLPNGSWSWWKGMRGNTYITVSVAEMLTRLNVMTGETASANMLKKAYSFLDDRLTETVEKMKEQKKKGIKPSFPGMTTLQMLYINAISGRELSSDVKKATDYLLPLLEKDLKKQTIYAKAMAAIVLDKNGLTKKARKFVDNVKGYTVYSETMGRYYDTYRAQQSWYSYKIPSHVMAMEAIRSVTPDDVKTIEEMQMWLLQEKRTTAWGNAIDNTNAVWAFLNGKPLDTTQTVAGRGYSKKIIDKPTEPTVTIEKSTEGTSWGAVYAQFVQKSIAVTAHGSDISVKREVLLPAETAKVGNKATVRLTIIAHRDMDIVEVVDNRAACMEPVRQTSGYVGGLFEGYYYSPKDQSTHYYFDKLAKGTHVIETEYYLDRSGTYLLGTATAGSAYATEFRATVPGETINVK